MKIVRENTGNIAPTIYIDIDRLNRALAKISEKNPIAKKLEGKLEDMKDLRESIDYPELPEDEQSKVAIEEELESLQEEVSELEYTLLHLVLTEAREEDWSSHGVSLYFSI
jgi:DNA repair ATPase RecN